MNNVLERTAAEAVEDREHLRRLTAERLDRAQCKLWPRVEKCDLAAVGVWLKIEDRRSRLLGLDIGVGLCSRVLHERHAAPMPGGVSSAGAPPTLHVPSMTQGSACPVTKPNPEIWARAASGVDWDGPPW
jgi:hypothetical protein